MKASSVASRPRRILIVRLSALGDVVMASGLIPALRELYPDTQISWLTEAGCAPLLRHNPQLHEVLIWPRAQWEQLLKAKRYGALWTEIRAFRAMLRAHRFDLALDAQGLLKSGLCTWFTGAPRRIGIIAREGSHLLIHERVIPPPDADSRIGAEYRYLACYLGAREESFQLDLSIGEGPRQTARQTLQNALGEASTKPLVVLCPFTTRPQKHWVDERWGELAKALHDQGMQAVLLGGPGDVVAAEKLASSSPNLLNLAGKLKLDESAALIADSQLLVGVDTGLTHMGTALRVPTVALFGSTRPYLNTGTPSTHVMYDALSCSPCRRNPTCQGRFDCMKQFTVARVLAEIRQVYQQGVSA